MGTEQITRESVEEAATELFALTGQDPDVMVAYRKGKRYTPRLRPFKVKMAPLTIPQTPRYNLVIPPSRLIADLKFAPCSPETVMEKNERKCGLIFSLIIIYTYYFVVISLEKERLRSR